MTDDRHYKGNALSKVSVLVATALMLVTAPSSGAAAQNDSCGPTYSETLLKLVPGLVNPIGFGLAVPFTVACERHDSCYRSSAYLTTGKYGDVESLSLVKKNRRLWEANKLKRGCDESFGDDLRPICRHELDGWKNLFHLVQCRALAAAYKKAVVNW